MRGKTIRLMVWGGIGDAILNTPVIRALKERHPRSKLKVYCGHKGQRDVFINNPYVDALIWDKLRVYQYLNFSRARLFRKQPLCSAYGLLTPSLFYSTEAVEIIAEYLDVELGSKRLQIFLTPAEERNAAMYLRQYSNVVVFHATATGIQNKTWPMEKWEGLIEDNPALTFIQLRAPGEPQVRNAADSRDMALREAFAIIKQSKGFVGLDSGLAHAATAFNTPSVVLFGPSTPAIWGHRQNLNLYKGMRCSPCVDILSYISCPYEKPCMNNISVKDVSEALRAKLNIN